MANGGDATCVPNCNNCDTEKRCRQCTNHQFWQAYNCVSDCHDFENRRPFFGHDNTGRYCDTETTTGTRVCTELFIEELGYLHRVIYKN